MGEAAGEQAAEGRHADEGHGVVAHDAAALVFGDEGLDDGVAGGHTLHHAKADDQHQQEREPEDCERPKATRPAPKTPAEMGIIVMQAADCFAQGERERGDQRADAGGAHEKAERVRAAMEHL